MIISHRHRFIYIKNRKVGSTSTELALQRLCGPEDVATPDRIHPPGPGSGLVDPLAEGARNWQGGFSPVREMLAARHPLDLGRVVRDWARRPRFYNHMRASSVRARVPRKVWDGYYKFCFERNPWDKVVSFYFWEGRHEPGPRPVSGIDAFVENHRARGSEDRALPGDWTRYAEGDRIIVDDVFDHADLAGNLREALRRAGVPQAEIEGLELGREKTTLRRARTAVFSAEADAVIRRVFRREIAAFPFCRAPLPGMSVRAAREKGGEHAGRGLKGA